MKTVDDAIRFFTVDARDPCLHARIKSREAEKALEIMPTGWPEMYVQLTGPFSEHMRNLTSRYPGSALRAKELAQELSGLMFLFQDVERA